MEVSSNLDGEIIFQYKSSNGDFNDKQKSIFKIHKGLNTLFVMAEPLENEKDLSMFRFMLPYNAALKFSTMKIFSAEYVKDFISAEPSDYFLKWIPYSWGTYDKNYKANKME